MKRKIISVILVIALVLSAVAIPVMAKSIPSSQQQPEGILFFPKDVINFNPYESSIRYNGYNSILQDITVNSQLVIVPGYADIFSTEGLPGNMKFYCWKSSNDTISTEASKRTFIELTPVFIEYDNEKAELTVTYSTDSASVRLAEKDGYILNSLAEGYARNNDSLLLDGLSAENLAVGSNIILNDSYTAEKPSVIISDTDGNKISDTKICPADTFREIQLSALSVYSSGAEAPDIIKWSVDSENVSVDQNGKVTVTPYFTDEEFTVTAETDKNSESVKVHVCHNFGEWHTTKAATIDAAGEEIRSCTSCEAVEKRPLEKLAAPAIIGTIAAGDDSWSSLIETPVSTKYRKSITLNITAADAENISDISYYISENQLTATELSAVTGWVSGNTVSLTSDGKYIVYVRFTDKDNNIHYISTDSIVIDNTAPVITGLNNNAVYSDDKTFTVSDTNLSKVLLNDVELYPVNGIYTIPATPTISAYTVKAIDKSGNTTEYAGTIYKNTTVSNNIISGITEDATYRKGSSLLFSATGEGMNNKSPKDGDIRYIPTSYKAYTNDTYHNFTSSRYVQTISTSKLEVGAQILSVNFNQQVYSSASGWTNTGIVDTKSIKYNLETREEIEKTRARVRSSFYTVKFDTNGGTKIDYVLVNRLKTISPPVVPTKTGYSFEGWYTNSACTVKYDFSTRVSSNMTLYAKWEKSSNYKDSSGSTPFKDVSVNDKYYENIAYVYATGLMNGTGEAEFSPDMPTTRAMIVTILYRLEGEPSVNSLTFSDVPSDAYYAKAVAWAKENDIVKGTSAYTFSPNNEISREQLMTMLYRYAEFKDYDRTSKAGLGEFKDTDQISAYASEAFKWAIATKVASGRTDTFLFPKASATRAEVAAAFKNFMEGNE